MRHHSGSQQAPIAAASHHAPAVRPLDTADAETDSSGLDDDNIGVSMDDAARDVEDFILTFPPR